MNFKKASFAGTMAIVGGALCLICVAALYFFNNVVSDSKPVSYAKKIMKDMREVEGAYFDRVANRGYGSDDGFIYLTSDGSLRASWVGLTVGHSLAPAKETKNVAGCTSEHGYGLSIGVDNLKGTPSIANDDYVATYCVAADICKAFNTEFAPITRGEIWDPSKDGGAWATVLEGPFCIKEMGGDHTIYLPLRSQ